jgi:hypothetical protein
MSESVELSRTFNILSFFTIGWVDLPSLPAVLILLLPLYHAKLTTALSLQKSLEVQRPILYLSLYYRPLLRCAEVLSFSKHQPPSQKRNIKRGSKNPAVCGTGRLCPFSFSRYFIGGRPIFIDNIDCRGSTISLRPVRPRRMGVRHHTVRPPACGISNRAKPVKPSHPCCAWRIFSHTLRLRSKDEPEADSRNFP